MTKHTKTIGIDYLAADVALIYRPLITPEGEGVRLDKCEDGLWRSDDIPGGYTLPSDAMSTADNVLPRE